MSKVDELIKKKKLLEAKKSVMERELPHLHLYKWYKWAKDFFDSRNKVTLLCAANQISKSSTQIRRYIDWATADEKWEELWPGMVPNLFWYFYPTKEVATVEFQKKWHQFLPNGAMKDDPKYGWTAVYDKRFIDRIDFNSGISIYFKSYNQNVMSLQSSTVYAVACFTEGHLVETNLGLKPIEDIKIGDLVPTRQGVYEKVQDTYSREMPIITRYLSNGEKLEGTTDHKVWTKNRGYVDLIELTHKDTLDISSTWELKKQNYTTELNTQDGLIQKIRDTIILYLQLERTKGLSTKLYGKNTIKKRSPLDLLSTIRMKMSQTTQLIIWNFLPELSTLGYIKFKSGKVVSLVSIALKLVEAAKKNLRLGPHKRLQESIVHKNVEKTFMSRLGDVSTAVKNLWLGKTPKDTFVLDHAEYYIRKKPVYNINVKNYHNYYLSGINLKNCDEELPDLYYDELMMRLAATDGYFSMAFTATIGQELWWRAMECIGKDSEFLPSAHKIQVSMYDCIKYIDGTETPWNETRIANIIEKCKSKAEVLRRVYGRFVKEGGKTYHTFDPGEHYIEPNMKKIEGWHKYAAVDIGSGGTDGHPAAVVFVAVKPDYTQGEIYKLWRGDGIQTTAGDIYEKFAELKGSDNLTRKWYDWASADFNAITTRLGDPFEKANKSHDLGESLLNTLFSNNMLKIWNTEDGRKLGGELITLQKSTPKNKAKDDLIDSTRYCTVEIPWDLKHIKSKKGDKKVVKSYQMPQNQDEWNIHHDKEREKGMKTVKTTDSWEFNAEIDFWNGEY